VFALKRGYARAKGHDATAVAMMPTATAVASTSAELPCGHADGSVPPPGAVTPLSARPRSPADVNKERDTGVLIHRFEESSGGACGDLPGPRCIKGDGSTLFCGDENLSVVAKVPEPEGCLWCLHVTTL
jgi:hypothetical protein